MTVEAAEVEALRDAQDFEALVDAALARRMSPRARRGPPRPATGTARPRARAPPCARAGQRPRRRHGGALDRRLHGRGGGRRPRRRLAGAARRRRPHADRLRRARAWPGSPSASPAAPPTRKRTYGFDRLSVLAAFVNGLALFVVAGLDRDRGGAAARRPAAGGRRPHARRRRCRARGEPRSLFGCSRAATAATSTCALRSFMSSATSSARSAPSSPPSSSSGPAGRRSTRSSRCSSRS